MINKKVIKKTKSKTIRKLIINIIAILLMLTGPILMILPGPQLLSWLGLALFIWINKDWLERFGFFRKLELKTKLWKLDRKARKEDKKLWINYKKR